LTEFIGELNNTNFYNLLNELHPTPAVCGIPLKEAQRIIDMTEEHERLDYTGFLGPVSPSKSHVFVNLRSAMIINQNIFLFLGGGITEGSIPEEEWKETELKANTLLDIL
jgi:isochorismate synthase